MPRVLIVEDAETCASTLEIALASIAGLAVTIAVSGRDAWRILQADAADPVSIVVTDLHMPYMDGFELIERMRADRRHAGTPVIVLSGDSALDSPERARRLGVAAYFEKPYSPAAVRHLLEQLLHANSRD